MWGCERSERSGEAGVGGAWPASPDRSLRSHSAPRARRKPSGARVRSPLASLLASSTSLLSSVASVPLFFNRADSRGLATHSKECRLMNPCVKLLWLVLLAACTRPSTFPPAATPEPGAMTAPRRAWWKEVVVYQVYPRSFQDSDGDGVGDIRGVTSRLDYIERLGVDVVWLNPVYQSPNDDNGYDISDYRAIMSEMGTMADFDAMLQGMHQRGIKLIMDLVVNHTSDEHPWFQQSRSSRSNPYRDYYHWWPAERGTPPHRWSFFDEEGSAWRYDSTTQAYYLHYFSRKQPDLKWENPRVRREVYDLMKFWFDKGVDGFRMDVIPFISKDTTFPPLPASFDGNYVAYYATGPSLHEYLREMNREVLSKYDVMTVGEGGGVAVEDALKFVAEDRHELQTFFQFELVDRWGRRPSNWLYPDSSNRSLPVFKELFSRSEER